VDLQYIQSPVAQKQHFVPKWLCELKNTAFDDQLDTPTSNRRFGISDARHGKLTKLRTFLNLVSTIGIGRSTSRPRCVNPEDSSKMALRESKTSFP